MTTDGPYSLNAFPEAIPKVASPALPAAASATSESNTREKAKRKSKPARALALSLALSGNGFRRALSTASRRAANRRARVEAAR